MQETLTDREMEIYKYLLKGIDYYTIADELGVRRSTIATHVLHIFGKMLVNSRQDLLVRRIEELEKEVDELKRTECITRA